MPRPPEVRRTSHFRYFNLWIGNVELIALELCSTNVNWVEVKAGDINDRTTYIKMLKVINENNISAN